MREINSDNYFWKNDLVELRTIEDQDWEAYYYNRFDSEGRRKLNCVVELPPTESEAKSFTDKFKNFNKSSERIMLTVLNMEGQNVGAININSIDEKNGTFSIGLQIDRDHRGKGYGTAAMDILMRYAFFERRLNKYYGHVIDGNIGSATMLKKLGCVNEGHRKELYYIDGRYIGATMYGLTKSEFIECRTCRNQ